MLSVRQHNDQILTFRCSWSELRLIAFPVDDPVELIILEDGFL